MKFMSDRSGAGFERPNNCGAALDAAKKIMGDSGAYAPPGQFVPPFVEPRDTVAMGPSALLTTGGVKTGPILRCDTMATAAALRSGVKSTRSSSVTPFAAYAFGLVGMGCVGEYHSPGTSPFSTGVSTNGHTGLPVTRS